MLYCEKENLWRLIILHETAEKILSYIKSRGVGEVPPTVREICKELSIKSTSTVHKYINQLVDEGYLEKTDGQNRTLHLPYSNPSASVPVIGTVTAGIPITAVENIDGYITYTGFRGDPNNLFALHVRGDSMINAGILNGDIVVVNRTPVAENGQIVVAMIDDEATVKRFYKENNHFRLQPENDDYEPIITDNVVILGKVIASIREY